MPSKHRGITDERIFLRNSEMSLWKSRVDCWYEPTRDIGKKQKPPKVFVRHVVLEAPDSEAAIKAAVKWAEDTAPMWGGRWVSFEHRMTGPFRLPFELKDGSDD